MLFSPLLPGRLWPVGMERGLFYFSGTELLSHSRAINSYLVSLLAPSSDRNSDSRLQTCSHLTINRPLSSVDSSRRKHPRKLSLCCAFAAVAKTWWHQPEMIGLSSWTNTSNVELWKVKASSGHQSFSLFTFLFFLKKQAFQKPQRVINSLSTKKSM